LRDSEEDADLWRSYQDGAKETQARADELEAKLTGYQAQFDAFDSEKTKRVEAKEVEEAIATATAAYKVVNDDLTAINTAVSDFADTITAQETE